MSHLNTVGCVARLNNVFFTSQLVFYQKYKVKVGVLRAFLISRLCLCRSVMLRFKREEVERNESIERKK